MAVATKKKPGFYLPPVELKLADANGLEDDAPATIELLRCGTFHHPDFGKVEITPAVCRSLVKNFSERVRKIDLAIDYKHDSEDIAAGWFKNISFDEKSKRVYAEIKWTGNGKRVLCEKEFRYVSAEFNLDYQDNESLKKFGPTLLGAGLTNRPCIKGMEAVVPLSEGDGKVQVMSLEDITKALMAMQAAIEQLKAAPKDDDLDPDAEPELDENGKPKVPLAPPAKVPPVKADDGSGGDASGDAAGTPDDEAKGKDKKQGDDMDAKDMADMKAKLDEANKKLAEYADKEKKATADAALAEKKKEFDVMLSEKRAVEAQREPFMKDDLKGFMAAQVAAPKTGRVSLSEAAAGGAAIDGAVDPQKEILKLSEKAVAEKKCDALSAISFVLSDPANKELRLAYERASYNKSFAPADAE